MRARAASLVGLTAALASTSVVQGDYLGVNLYIVGQVNTPAGPRKVYRIYALFSEGSDRVLAWGGSSVNPTDLYTIHCTVPTLQLGAPFWQAGGGGNTAPTQYQIDTAPQIAWDTFVTIGVSVADQGSGPPGAPDETRLSGDFSTLNSNRLTLTSGTGAAVYLATPDAAQARADYAGDGDAPLRVLLAQFTVDPNNDFYGVIGFLMFSTGGNTVTLTNQTWFSQGFGWGACCLPDGSCAVMSGIECGFMNGTLMCECEDCPPPPCDADVDGNGAVDVDDLITVILGWGPCPDKCSECAADINGSCDVDVDDLIAVLLGWGPCRE